MKQVIFIGFSTTGKSTLINKLADKFPHRRKFDTDKEISKDFGGSITNIYYAYANLNDTHEYIKRQESGIICELTKATDNLIIAAGPGIPFRPAFSTYIQAKKPHVVLIERPAEEIYSSLLDRRKDMKIESSHKRPDFGKWDIGVMVDDKLVEYSRETAIQKIQSILVERHHSYNAFTTLKIKSSDIFKDPLPKSLLDII